MSSLNVIVIVIVLVFAVNSHISFPKNEEENRSSEDAAVELGLKTLVNLKDENAVVAPTNIYTCLRLLYSGARGDTKTELGNILGSIDKENVLSGVHTANALFLNPDISVKQEYLTFTNQSIFTVDFYEAQATKEIINGWVSQQTKGTITQFLETPVDSSSVAVVVSALYFNLSWLYRFEPAKMGSFEVSSDLTVQTPLMTVSATLPGYAGTDFRAVGLPYENTDFTFYILMPNSAGVRALKNMIRHLTPESINKMVASMQQENLVVTVPKFLLNGRTELRPILQSLGVNKIFNPLHADFGDLFDQTNGTKLYVSDIFQSVYLKIDESGTEGSAATGVTLTRSGRSLFRATRPFAFILRHKSGQVLFLGTLTNPK